jgi:hypothetical protein
VSWLRSGGDYGAGGGQEGDSLCLHLALTSGSWRCCLLQGGHSEQGLEPSSSFPLPPFLACFAPLSAQGRNSKRLESALEMITEPTEKQTCFMDNLQRLWSTVASVMRGKMGIVPRKAISVLSWNKLPFRVRNCLHNPEVNWGLSSLYLAPPFSWVQQHPGDSCYPQIYSLSDLTHHDPQGGVICGPFLGITIVIHLHKSHKSHCEDLPGSSSGVRGSMGQVCAIYFVIPSFKTTPLGASLDSWFCPPNLQGSCAKSLVTV